MRCSVEIWYHFLCTLEPFFQKNVIVSLKVYRNEKNPLINKSWGIKVFFKKKGKASIKCFSKIAIIKIYFLICAHKHLTKFSSIIKSYKINPLSTPHNAQNHNYKIMIRVYVTKCFESISPIFDLLILQNIIYDWTQKRKEFYSSVVKVCENSWLYYL